MNDNKPTIDGVFNGLTSTLSLIKSCSIRSTSELYDKAKLNYIREYIFSFPSGVSLSYINTAIEQIEEIKTLKEKLVSKIVKDYDQVYDGEDLKLEDPDPEVSEEDIKRNAKLYIDGLLTSCDKQLKKLAEEITNRELKINTPTRNKLKLNLSVEEIATLFRGLKEAKAIDKVSVTFLSRFILQNFESKDKNDVLSEDSIRNKYYSPTGKAINSTIATLNSIIDQLKKIKEKI